ncbi:hypothetical protein ACFW04_011334 [Cataglyphis niger]
MLSYMLPTEDKPPPASSQQNNYRATGKLQKSTTAVVSTTSPRKCADATRTMIVSTRIEDSSSCDPIVRHGSPHPASRPIESPKHNGTATATNVTANTTARKSTLHNANRVTKDDSLYSIDSDASTAGSERKNKILNGAKHASLKR